jgi:hypothetical protein
MKKTNYKSLLAIPYSQNFSDLPSLKKDNGEIVGLDFSDNGREVDAIASALNADALLLSLLLNLNDREKIIFLYQLLREMGYNLNHEDCSKTINVTREYYMTLLKAVKDRSVKILQMLRS